MQRCISGREKHNGLNSPVPCSPAANFGDRAKCDELLFTFKITPVSLVSHICGILIIVTSGMCPINNEKHYFYWRTRGQFIKEGKYFGAYFLSIESVRMMDFVELWPEASSCSEQNYFVKLHQRGPLYVSQSFQILFNLITYFQSALCNHHNLEFSFQIFVKCEVSQGIESGSQRKLLFYSAHH